MSEEVPPEFEGESSSDERFRLAAEVEILREENANLRREYARARRVRNRNAAVGLAAVGAVAVAAAVVLPSVRTILLVLGATGAFTATLVYFLEPTRVLPASVSEAVYGTLAANESALVAELGLDAPEIYVPTDASGTPSVVLFITQSAADDHASLPDSDSLFVISDEERAHGVALHPSGVPLLEAVRPSMPDEVGRTPGDLGNGLADAIELLGVADAASASFESDNHLRVGISGQSYGSLDRFDHPVVSLFAVGLASTLDEPVRVENVASGDRTDEIVEFRWGD